jgi:hypothetical protein
MISPDFGAIFFMDGVGKSEPQKSAALDLIKSRRRIDWVISVAAFF